jgi:hypothetical protein
VPLSYSNPTYTTTSNNFTAISLSRSSSLYATSSASTALCPVTTGLTISTASIFSSSSLTYRPTTI